MPLPERVVVDTSFVFSSIVQTQPLHNVCQAYLARLANNNTALVFNHLVDIELAEIAFKLPLFAKYKNGFRRYRNDGRSRPRAARFMHDVQDAWDEILQHVPHRRVDLHTVSGHVDGLMSNYGLGSYDAVHAATALATGVTRLVTTDAGFGNVPSRQLTLYVDETRTASCRARRARV